ncbi:ENR1 protein, partial [Leucopsar rothschildi]|nr:ENR1 protein [Leucopsar rothschildi]
IEQEKLYECVTRHSNPFLDESQLSKFWSNRGIDTVNPPGFWRAPKKLFWRCGRMAYVMLPKTWVGSCSLGIIRPSFFLLPRTEGQHLGILL